MARRVCFSLCGPLVLALAVYLVLALLRVALVCELVSYGLFTVGALYLNALR